MPKISYHLGTYLLYYSYTYVICKVRNTNVCHENAFGHGHSASLKYAKHFVSVVQSEFLQFASLKYFTREM